MVSNKPDASAISSTVEELKASRREIQSQHATIGLELSTLDARISTLESQLREYVGRESEVMPTSDKINLKVIGLDGRQLCFAMKGCTRIEKLMKAWGDHVDECYENVRLIFKGKQLQTDQTLEQIGIQDGAVIHAIKRLAGS